LCGIVLIRILEREIERELLRDKCVVPSRLRVRQGRILERLDASCHLQARIMVVLSSEAAV
jgi:hypothetical protein